MINKNILHELLCIHGIWWASIVIEKLAKNMLRIFVCETN